MYGGGCPSDAELLGVTVGFAGATLGLSGRTRDAVEAADGLVTPSALPLVPHAATPRRSSVRPTPVQGPRDMPSFSPSGRTEHAQGAVLRHFGEAVRDRGLHDVPRRLATVGRIREDVVHEEQSTGHQVPGERAVVVLRRLLRVVAVEEEQLERR